MFRQALTFAILATLLLFPPGCGTVNTVAPLALPAAVCGVLAKEPGAEQYIRQVQVAVETFAGGEDLSAEQLQKALATIRVTGIAPSMANAVWGGVAAVYRLTAEKYANDPAKVPKLQESLLAIATGLDSGLNACGTPPPVVVTRGLASPKLPTISPDSLQALADAIKSNLAH